MGVHPYTISRWKLRKLQPHACVLQAIRLLVMIRIGLPQRARDLIHPPSRGALEILVDRYLAEEQLQLARRRLRKEQRKIGKLAKVVPKVDTQVSSNADLPKPK